jgi:ketosteroid isomerase-like protein
MATEQNNVDIILTMYRYFESGDVARISTELMHPDIVWRVPGHHPLAGAHTGPEQVLGFLGRMAATGIQFTDLHFGQLDDGTVVEKHLGIAKLGAEQVELPAAVTYGIRDGRIADVRVNSGDQHALDRFVWSAVTLRPVTERLAA